MILWGFYALPLTPPPARHNKPHLVFFAAQTNIQNSFSDLIVTSIPRVGTAIIIANSFWSLFFFFYHAVLVCLGLECTVAIINKYTVS